VPTRADDPGPPTRLTDGEADDHDDHHDDDGSGFDVSRASPLVVASVLFTGLATPITLLMLGSLFAGAMWLAPLLSMVVLLIGVLGIGLAAAAVVSRCGGAWAALGFAVLPCAVVIVTWAWAIRRAKWGPGS
jgi:hypothetical protein